MTQSLGPARRDHRPSLVLGIIVTCQLMVVLDTAIVNIALPSIKRSFGVDEAHLSWILNAYTLTFGGLLTIGGRAGDIFGRRRLAVVGLALFTIASLTGGLSVSSEMLIASRAVQGIGAAIISPTALALILHNFNEGAPRARAIGTYAAVSGAGAGLGLVAGGILTGFLSWNWVLFVNVPIGVTLMVLLPLYLGETPRQSGRFDTLGALTSTLTMSALTYGFINAAAVGWQDATTISAFIVGIVGGAGFFVIESRVEQPIVPLRLFRDRNRSSALAIRFLLIAGMTGMFFFLTQFVQDILGLSPLIAGFAFLPTTVATVTTSRIVPKLVPRVGVKRLTVIGAVLVVAGMVWLTQLSADTTYLGGILGPILLFGVGVALPLVTVTMLAVDRVERKDAGAVSSVLNVMQQVGASVGLAILVTVFSAANRSTTPDPANTAASDTATAHAIAASFCVATVFTLIIFGLATFAIKVPKPPT